MVGNETEPAPHDEVFHTVMIVLFIVLLVALQCLCAWRCRRCEREATMAFVQTVPPPPPSEKHRVVQLYSALLARWRAGERDYDMNTLLRMCREPRSAEASAEMHACGAMDVLQAAMERERFSASENAYYRPLTLTLVEVLRGRLEV